MNIADLMDRDWNIRRDLIEKHLRIIHKETTNNDKVFDILAGYFERRRQLLKAIREFKAFYPRKIDQETMESYEAELKEINRQIMHYVLKAENIKE